MPPEVRRRSGSAIAGYGWARRGGCFRDPASSARVIVNAYTEHDRHDYETGIRLARDLDGGS
jgi:hypothetical protein